MTAKKNTTTFGIGNYLKAGYSHFFVEVLSGEINRATDLITEEIKFHTDSKGEKPFNNVMTWGITPPPVSSKKEREDLEEEHVPNPMAPIVDLENAPKNSVMILKNYNWFIRDEHGVPNYNIVQYLQDRIAIFKGKDTRRVVIIVSAKSIGDSLPSEIIRDFIPLHFHLPSREEIIEVLDASIKIAKKSDKFVSPTKVQKEVIISNSVGLTCSEAEDAYFYSMAKTGGVIDPDIVQEIRMSYLEDVAGIKYVKYDETLDSLIGYDIVKKFAMATLPNPDSKGFLLLGPAGCGKSHLAKAMAKATGLPMLTVEMAEWFTSLYGETGQRVRRGIEAIKAFENVIVFVDEIEKGLAGTSSGMNKSEGHEETQRAMSQFLKFLNDRPAGIRIVATCNNIFGLDPAYIRAERWDTAPFFIDLPDEEVRDSIMDHYKDVYGVEGKVACTEGWSGAEVKACCRLAKIMNTTVDKASQFILPVSEVMKEDIDELRRLCKNRTLPASTLKVEGFSTRSIDI